MCSPHFTIATLLAIITYTRPVNAVEKKLQKTLLQLEEMGLGRKKRNNRLRQVHPAPNKQLTDQARQSPRLTGHRSLSRMGILAHHPQQRSLQ